MYVYINHPERPFKLHVFIGVNPKEISKRLNRNRKKLHPFGKDYFSVHENDEAMSYNLEDVLPGHFVIQFTEFPGMGTLAHEVFHVVAQHFRYVNMPLTKSSEESYAYMISYLIQHIIDETAKHKG